MTDNTAGAPGEDRAPAHRGARYSAALASVILTAWLLGSPTNPGEPSRADVQTFSPPVPGAATLRDRNDRAPDLAEVVCDVLGRTVVVTPLVRPQRDGIHVTVQNRTGKPFGFQVLHWMGIGGGDVEPGTTEFTDSSSGGAWQVGPGTFRVRCRDHTKLDAAEQQFLDIGVVDPNGLWAPMAVVCEGSRGWGILDVVSLDFGEGTDPIEIARRHFRRELREGDVVRLVGYPQARRPTVGLVRRGVVKGTITLSPTADGGWITTESVSCSED